MSVFELASKAMPITYISTVIKKARPSSSPTKDQKTSYATIFLMSTLLNLSGARQAPPPPYSTTPVISSGTVKRKTCPAAKVDKQAVSRISSYDILLIWTGL